LQGILIDQWGLWEKKTGIKADIHAMDWGEAMRRMRAGEFDVIDDIVETPERRIYFDFSPIYSTIETSIYFRDGITGIADLASLKGFPVGIKAGDERIDRLKENGVTTVIQYKNNREIVEAAKERKIDVFVVDGPSARYFLKKMGIANEFRQSAPIFHDQVRRAVRKGNLALLLTVSDGFAAIDPDELKQIDDKWLGYSIDPFGRYAVYARYALVAAMLLIAGLAAWNHTLTKRVQRRTAALAESKLRFLSLFQNMAEGVAYLRMKFEDGQPQDAVYLEVNPAWEKLTGLINVVGRKTSEVTPGIRRASPAFFEHCGRVAVTGQPERFEIYSPPLKKWLSVSAYCPRSEHVAVVLDDIAQRKRADEALRQSEFDLAEAQRIARIGNWSRDITSGTVR
jgi:PAS domain-containing protein